MIPQDKWGPILIMIAAAFYLSTLGGCAHIRADQRYKDSILIDLKLLEFKWTVLRNAFDKNELDRLRFDIRKALTNAD